MAFVLRWTRLALADLVSIRDHIATDNPSAGQAMVAAVREAVERLTEFPHSGRIVPERRAQGYREVIVAPYRIVYSVVGGVAETGQRVPCGHRRPLTLLRAASNPEGDVL